MRGRGSSLTTQILFGDTRTQIQWTKRKRKLDGVCSLVRKGDAVLYKEVLPEETDEGDYILRIYCTNPSPDELFYFMMPVLTLGIL